MKKQTSHKSSRLGGNNSPVFLGRASPSVNKRTIHPKIELSDPVVVAQAADQVRQWGEFQFPGIEHLPDGRLHVSYTPVGYRDSVADYGKPVAHAVSSNEGKSWTAVEQQEVAGHPEVFSAGTLLANGDRLVGVRRPTLPITEKMRMMLPKPLAKHPCVFKAENFPKELAGYRVFRLPADKKHWIEEYAEVDIPGAVRGIIAADVEVNLSGEVRSMKNGLLFFPTIGREASTHQSGIVLPDHSLLFTTQFARLLNGKLREDYALAFLSSTDHGHTWRLKSEIPYAPDKKEDPTWKERDQLGWHMGFGEPDITILPDGSIFCLMRTTAGSTVIGPTYWTRSEDGGITWSKPGIFDTFGVLPKLLTLKNGVTLASYGRPGFYVRATSDPSGRSWAPRVEVIQPSLNRNRCNWHNLDTCGYSDMVALDEKTALVVYCDFEYPASVGARRACKTILTQKIVSDA